MFASNQMLLAERADHCPTLQPREKKNLSSQKRSNVSVYMFWSVARLSAALPATNSAGFRHHGWQVPPSWSYNCLGSQMPDGTEPKGLVIIPKYVATRSEPNQGPCL